MLNIPESVVLQNGYFSTKCDIALNYSFYLGEATSILSRVPFGQKSKCLVKRQKKSQIVYFVGFLQLSNFPSRLIFSGYQRLFRYSRTETETKFLILCSKRAQSSGSNSQLLTFQPIKNKQTFVQKLFGNPIPPIKIFSPTKLNPLLIKYSLLSLQKDPLIPFHHSQTGYEHSNDVSILTKQLKKDSLFLKHSE